MLYEFVCIFAYVKSFNSPSGLMGYILIGSPFYISGNQEMRGWITSPKFPASKCQSPVTNPGCLVLKPEHWTIIPVFFWNSLVVIHVLNQNLPLYTPHPSAPTCWLYFCHWGEIGESYLEFPTYGSRGMGKSQEMLCQSDGSGDGKEAGRCERCSIHWAAPKAVSIRSDTY